MKPILLLSGPVGAGKTTVARELLASTLGPTVYIEGDLFWSFIAKGADSHKQYHNFQMIMRSMTAAAVPYALSGYDTILDFSIPPSFLDTVRRIAGIREVPVDYVVLYPGEAVCASRAGDRAQGRIADYGSYSEFYREFGEAGEDHLLRGEEDPTVLAIAIRRGREAGKFRLR